MANFQKRNKGDSFSVSAVEFNAMLDAAVAHKHGGKGGSAGTKGATARDSTTVAVRNNSGEQIERFRAVRLVDPVVTPADSNNEDEFKNRPVLNIAKPTTAARGKWAVVQQDIPNGELGQAVVLGLTVCRVNVAATADTYVETENNSYIPKSGTSGLARLVWVAGGVGTATATGEQWALILLDANTPSITKVKCTDDYGHGSSTVAVKTLDASNAVTGDSYDVQIVHHTSVNDVFYVFPAGTTFVQLGYPAQRSQFMVLQCMDASGGPQAIDWDYLKAHE